MAYDLMKRLIKNGKKTVAELKKKADVFYAVEELSDDEYIEIMALIKAM